ncbi:aspartate carbamoyltransferase [Hyperthermus butylicus]|uniref:Aspartate carbamoyltransferase catalytic subunit n=1 Tax=Hyperthermus butylicus (strain DSM 5456 / JCM 9403 / PLM1-5) TaxID=415426 RepID=PYRB_HYPBU|nr:aspartate carbamoyltransferase [Hyperthermus butylicus]A2BJ24.1 RecName: Full=Aspartate carbamoyltransferase catalytic subunit; AltName: Full=Aspartate transcarbamylase; Short=ATCase [Hyperthermus butylicus DSM 5456]ABM79985.1 Aspartate carbamoyltransferase [Hyperthermus butylicus DSM 5456]
MGSGSGWKGRDVISILDFDRDSLEQLFEVADKFSSLLRERGRIPLLEGYIVALAFFEPSTRTRLSFETAAKRLGADTIGFTSEEAISIAKGETLADTIRMLDSYADMIVLRHRYEGAALYAAEIAEHPVINAGDGKQHHPTQAMLDLYTVRKLFGTIDGLTYGVLGDLRYGRAASSFILALTIYRPRMIYLISPPLLRVRPEVRMVLDERGMRYREVESLEEVLGELDVLYVTRIQRERFPDQREYEKVRGSYRVTLELLEQHARRELRILHPLPRVDEIAPEVDGTPYAAYFEQARNGVPVRMALLALIAGREV